MTVIGGRLWRWSNAEETGMIVLTAEIQDGRPGAEAAKKGDF